ncbi:uncharacterized protein SPPG_06350 [Spizellomyces punctatus DAOM BR117]|uniref:RING-type domain-containing protein n=1 Tax=Spizellomyces punctatus (strain DAOM BR117) TaxID=645134 RepID=A0A0L0HD79_SPIPD|nr:uncharacterized protein SPPG_06350 [Spizellomyces punctatus DAOM BR117]KNC98668.1 hypothetical protein SPPG_06350 [Spizellomyces punctatus DAOM BR117]|eukprot:XP_016606708.1 hypothetical protein SPPG_06350 [Spizellomyces punctatus DAOM BR117]
MKTRLLLALGCILLHSALAQFPDPSIEYGYALIYNSQPLTHDTLGATSNSQKNSPLVIGIFSNAPAVKGDIVPFAGMPLPGDNAEGLLIHYNDGCTPAPNISLPLDKPTNRFVGLLNATSPVAPCPFPQRITDTITHLKAHNGVGLVVYGDGRHPVIRSAITASWPTEFALPTYFIDMGLGGFLENFMGSTVNGSEFKFGPDQSVPLVVGQPFPPNFPLPAQQQLVNIMVRIALRRGSQSPFPPLWKFALVSLAIFTGLSIPAAYFLRRRAARQLRGPLPGQPPAPTLLSASHLQHHPLVVFGDLPDAATIDPTCSICLDVYSPTTMVRKLVPCGHVFHPSCVDRWVTEVAGVCPLCRVDLVGKGAEQVVPVRWWTRVWRKLTRRNGTPTAVDVELQSVAILPTAGPGSNGTAIPGTVNDHVDHGENANVHVDHEPTPPPPAVTALRDPPV